MRSLSRVGLVVAASFAVSTGMSSGAWAQVQELLEVDVELSVDSAFVQNDGEARAVVYSTVVRVPDVDWLRLRLDERTVLADAPDDGLPAAIRVTSLRDGGVQTLFPRHLKQWSMTTAYFNGNLLLVELLADPGAAESRLVLTSAMAGPRLGVLHPTICGPTDDRLLSEDDRVGRLVPIGCTAWLIDDQQHCFLTAGHCAGSGAQVMEFNVPLSDSNGNIRHPGPEDQYALDPVSMQTNGGQGIGNDWAYFGCFANTETGLTPFEAQQDFFVLADTPPPVQGQDIRITGYGTMDVPPEWNQAQKTHTGPYAVFDGTTIQYRTDTTGGNSGSPVIDETTGMAIGIHTHGGCSVGGGANSGTGSNRPALQNAIANPRGVCAPPVLLTFDYPNGRPDLLDPDGDSIRVVVAGQGKGVPQPGTGQLHYDVGGGFVTVAMVEVETNVYDAVFPAIDCGATVSYYVSADTVGDETVNDPANAPTTSYQAIATTALEVVFADDFESDNGWTVENEELADGAWERGVPAGGGGRGDPANDFDGSGNCFVTDNVAGNSDVDGGPTRMISPALDLSGLDDPVIRYARWFTNDDQDQDRLDIHVSNDDGASWTLVETVGSQFGWVETQFALRDYVAPTGTVRVRFSATDNPNDSVTEAGIDGVQVLSPVCGGGLLGDLDEDGDVDFDFEDLLLLLSAWGDCEDPPAKCPADLDDDGLVGFGDLLILLANWT